MTKPAKLVLVLVIVIILGGIIYFESPVLIMWLLIHSMDSQMSAGQQYMDSITERDIHVWIERTKKYLNEYDPKSDIIGVYGSDNNPVPADLKELKILRIDISRDFVNYVWLGGMDHTYLQVQRNEQGDFKITVNYNDYSSKVIWPKEENANQPIENAATEPCIP
jgi:hypothetical protein